MDQILWGLPFFACTDRSGQEKALNFSIAFMFFGRHFKVLKRLIPKHHGDSRNLRDGFTNSSRRFLISFSENHSQGVNSSWRLYESTTHKYYWRYVYKFDRFFPFVGGSPRKIWTNHILFKFVNPLRRFQGSPRILV